MRTSFNTARETTICFEGVSKRYKRVRAGSVRRALDHMIHRTLGVSGTITALNNVNLEVNRGERLAIIGGNGAGKTTALQLVAGITHPTRGVVTVRGRVAPLLDVGAGFHDDLTGRENVYLNGVIMGLSRREVSAKYEDIVAFAELEEFMDTPVKYYSSGMYLRLGFAVAAYLDPDVLLIDEILAVGDAAFQAKSLERMHQVARSGSTVVFISHNLESVRELCTRGIYLRSGEVMLDDSVDAAIDRYLEDVDAGLVSLHHEGVDSAGAASQAV